MDILNWAWERTERWERWGRAELTRRLDFKTAPSSSNSALVEFSWGPLNPESHYFWWASTWERKNGLWTCFSWVPKNQGEFSYWKEKVFI